MCCPTVYARPAPTPPRAVTPADVEQASLAQAFWRESPGRQRAPARAPPPDLGLARVAGGQRAAGVAPPRHRLALPPAPVALSAAPRTPPASLAALPGATPAPPCSPQVHMALERCIGRGMSKLESVQLLARLGVAPKFAMIGGFGFGCCFSCLPLLPLCPACMPNRPAAAHPARVPLHARRPPWHWRRRPARGVCCAAVRPLAVPRRTVLGLKCLPVPTPRLTPSPPRPPAPLPLQCGSGWRLRIPSSLPLTTRSSRPPPSCSAATSAEAPRGRRARRPRGSAGPLACSRPDAATPVPLHEGGRRLLPPNHPPRPPSSDPRHHPP